MPSRILLLMDNRADSNWGSQASTSMLVALLKERYPGAEIRGIPRDLAGHRGIFRRIGERLLPKALLSGKWNSVGARIGLFATTLKWRNLRSWPDLIVVNGEGTLHPQRQLLRWLPLIVYLRKRSGAPVWILNSSLELNADENFTMMFRRTLQQVDRFAAREPTSFEIAKSLHPGAELVADCAFLIEPDDSFEVDLLLDQLGVTRPFVVVTGSAVGPKWNVEITRQLIDTARAEGLDAIFARSTDDDEGLYARIDRNLPVVTECDLTPAQYVAVIRAAQALVGGRFHPTIFAATVGTPFVASESNTHKMEGLMQMLDSRELLTAQSDAEGQIRALRNILAHRDEYSTKLATRAAELRAAARRNVPEDPHPKKQLLGAIS